MFHRETGSNLIISSPTYKLISERQDSLSESTLADTDRWQTLNDRRTLMKSLNMLHSIIVRIYDQIYNQIARSLLPILKTCCMLCHI